MLMGNNFIFLVEGKKKRKKRKTSPKKDYLILVCSLQASYLRVKI